MTNRTALTCLAARRRTSLRSSPPAPSTARRRRRPRCALRSRSRRVVAANDKPLALSLTLTLLPLQPPARPRAQLPPLYPPAPAATLPVSELSARTPPRPRVRLTTGSPAEPQQLRPPSPRMPPFRLSSSSSPGLGEKGSTPARLSADCRHKLRSRTASPAAANGPLALPLTPTHSPDAAAAQRRRDSSRVVGAASPRATLLTHCAPSVSTEPLPLCAAFVCCVPEVDARVLAASRGRDGRARALRAAHRLAAAPERLAARASSAAAKAAAAAAEEGDGGAGAARARRPSPAAAAARVAARAAALALRLLRSTSDDEGCAPCDEAPRLGRQESVVPFEGQAALSPPPWPPTTLRAADAEQPHEEPQEQAAPPRAVAHASAPRRVFSERSNSPTPARGAKPAASPVAAAVSLR